MKSALLLLALFGSLTAQAESMVLYKSADPTVAIRIEDDGSARIYRRDFFTGLNGNSVESGLKEKEILASGTIEYSPSGDSLALKRAEGDVCPTIHMDMYRSIENDEYQGALVTMNLDGTASRVCSQEVIEGDYSREYFE